MNHRRHIRGRTSCRAVFTLCLGALLQACGGGGGSDSPPVTPPPAPPPVSKQELAEAARFAGQASFGIPYEELEALARSGRSNWIDAQFALPASLHKPLIDDFVQRREAGEFAQFEEDIEYLIYFRRLAWWHQTITGNDLLRQRVAFALSEILVVSDNTDALLVDPYALSTYYDTLQTHAFGNFRDLLRDVSLHPSMGVFLSHINNARSNPAANTFPDENYAREVMQLFSIGLFELNIDGSPVTDADGRPVPTYDNDDIREFAKIFTGLSFGGQNSFFGRRFGDFKVPMQMFEDAHEPGEKRLLRGQVVPAGQSGLEDIEAAIDNLFNHPNVGPFIGKQLIQRLVTSNPSPAYVERVARAFNGETSGVRGDMRAVIRAILLDPEASADSNPASNFGKLREPVVVYTRILRQFGAESADGFIANLGFFLQGVTRQHPLSSPSVFNFFLPSHSPPGAIADANLVAPEFQIATSTTVISTANLFDAILFGDFATDAPEPFATVTLNLDPYLAVADDTEALLDRLDVVLTEGTVSTETRTAVANAIDASNDPSLRVRMAIYLYLISPDHAVRL
ncbi:MAG: DUF1800 domain-containing protein [Pseudomonadota bacterium]